MIRQPAAYLLLHGSIVILIGLLTGLLLKTAIVKQKANLNAWRVTHSVLVMDGIFMLVAGAILPHLFLDDRAAWVLVWSLASAGYGFMVAFPVGAWKGVRGLTFKPYGLHTLLFTAHSVGVVGSLVGVLIMIYGSLRTF